MINDSNFKKMNSYYNNIKTLAKKKIHLLYDNDYWAYYKECVELHKRCPQNMEITYGNSYSVLDSSYDLVVQMVYGCIKRLNTYLNSFDLNIPVCVTYTVGKGYSDKVLQDIYNDHCKNIIINNLGMYNQFGKKQKTIYIPNGVDCKYFYDKKYQRKKKVIFIGSEWHRIVKGYNDILLPLKDKLECDGIICDFKIIDNTNRNNVISMEDLREWYNESMVYVVAAKSEGTPNPALEAASCGCTIVSTRVGNMPELITDGYNGYLCDRNVDELYTKIKMAIDNFDILSLNMQKEISEHWNWDIISPKFYNYFLSICK